LRRNQRISLGQDAGNHLFCIESGCLTVDAALANGRRVVMQILYPGDIVSRAAYPPMPQVDITAKTAAVVQRFASGGIQDASGMLIENLLGLGAATTRLLARSNLHVIVLGRLSGEERLATLLVELALELGQKAAGGISFELPLSRADMADYLALNPDTLSRLLSRMRSRNLLAVPARNRAILKSLEGAIAMTPLYSELRKLHARD
jgi:CRP/FNR family transcriptional regulator, anaerobic regulatory protein